MAEFFPSVDVGKVDFDGWDSYRRDGVAEGHARVGVATRVQDDDVEIAFGGLYPIDQFALKVRLAEFDADPQLGGAVSDVGLDVGQGRAPVNIWFPLAEQVQVGTV